jgi:hypothetical protein
MQSVETAPLVSLVAQRLDNRVAAPPYPPIDSLNEARHSMTKNIERSQPECDLI